MYSCVLEVLLCWRVCSRSHWFKLNLHNVFLAFWHCIALAGKFRNPIAREGWSGWFGLLLAAFAGPILYILRSLRWFCVFIRKVDKRMTNKSSFLWFCLQMCFETEERARRLLHNVSSLLKPGGYFLGITPDSSTIWYEKSDCQSCFFFFQGSRLYVICKIDGWHMCHCYWSLS